MKKFTAACALLVSSLGLGAAIERVALNPDSPLPVLPASMQMEAITEGRVLIVVDIDANGHPTDSLVLAYTEPRLARACADSVGRWLFRPARIDGVAVPSQTEVTVNFSSDGVVVTSNLGQEVFLRSLRSDPLALTVLTCDAARLDHTPARLGGTSPAYATAALQAGVRGAVTVHFYIDENGTVRMPAVNADAHPYLARQAVAALAAWKFEPPTRGSRPVLVAAEEKFSFGAH